MINLDVCLDELETVYEHVNTVYLQYATEKNIISDFIYDLTTLDEVMTSIHEMIEFNRKMNSPEGVTIDLMNDKKDYKDECERLSAILEDVTDEKDRLEHELFETQSNLRNCQHQIAMIRGLICSDDTAYYPDVWQPKK